MANRFSSPCPTSHDTPGQSGLFASPSGSAIPRRKSLPHLRTKRKSISSTNPQSPLNPTSPYLSRKSRIPVRESPKKMSNNDHSDDEVDLSEYTFDLNKLPGELVSIGKEDGEKKQKKQDARENPSSDIEGPEDFTLNMVELLKNVDLEDTQRTQVQVKGEGGKEKVNASKENKGEAVGEQDDRHDPEGPTRATGLPDYTQLEHTMETSTPAHFLWRDVNESLQNTSVSKRQSSPPEKVDKTDDVQENSVIYTPGRKSAPTTPTIDLSRMDDTMNSQGDQTLCAAQQICQLELDLEAKTRRIREMEAKLTAEASLRKEINELKQQLQRRDEITQLTDAELNELRKTKSQLEQARSDITNLTSKESTLRGNLKEKTKQLKDAEKKLEETRLAHKRHSEEIGAELKQTKQECEKKLGGVYSLKYQLTSVTRERDSIKKTSEDLENTVRKLKAQVETAESQKAEEAAESLARLREVQKFAGELALPALGKPFFEIVTLLREHVKNLSEKTLEEQKQRSKESEDAQKELQKLLKKANGAARLEARKAELYRDRLTETSSKIESVKSENTELLERIAVLTCDNAKLKKKATETTQEHDQALDALRKLRAEAEESHKSQIAKLKSSHSEQLAKYRNNTQGPSSELQARLAASKNRESVLTAELKAEQEARERLEEDMTRMEAEIAHHHMTQKRLEAIIKANTSAAKKIDGKIVEIMREREDVWKSRVDELTRDNEKLGKVLMTMWGKQEVGDHIKLKKNENGDKQGYKYKYARKVQDIEIGEIWNTLLGEPAS
ncbi:hypothetical protein MGYG_04260 [Nannizzia gypsea CBS 118893]|uniref:Spindle pole body associated protein SnaD n=1 Tax=Arthroderma gypseum (strain ATCC MYA-4604 / CBS 118893) TaxID=535722 RepID=E4URZ8_ARTGP|nr:hypothetical protein MGYG_04260 [Nannizzia gypsea CBS 118893]EFR01255.1 hypothetical protein MGYG_04260 [Nannizzia gypsea CBS 118893]